MRFGTSIVVALTLAASGTLSAAEKISVLVTVTDRSDNGVEISSPSNIRVYDDGKPQTVLEVVPQRDSTFSVAIVIDRSGSGAEWIRRAGEEAARFLRMNVRKGKDRAATIAFDSRPFLLQDFTDDEKLLSNSLSDVLPGGGSALYDAVVLAGRQLTNEKARRIMLVVSDGADNASRSSIRDAIEVLQRNNIVLHAVYVEPPTNRSRFAPDRSGPDELRRIANTTGGIVYSTASQDLRRAFERISRAIQSQYAVTYEPMTPIDSDRSRDIRIESTDSSQRIHTRSHYYGPTAPR